MDYYPRKNPNWIVPALLFVCTLWATNEYMDVPYLHLGHAITAIWGWWTLDSYIKSGSEHWVGIFERVKHALARTAEVLRLEAAERMHPETLRMLYHSINIAWRRKAGIETPDNEPYSVLYADPTITDSFIAYVLDNSSTFQLMPKRKLADKSYSFDPMGETQDYQQYDAFLAWLKLHNMVTDAGPNSPPAWIAPYCPEVVAKSLGWDWEGHGLKELD